METEDQTEKYIQQGKLYGYSGKELRDFVAERQKEMDEREERALRRQIEAEKREREREKEKEKERYEREREKEKERALAEKDKHDRELEREKEKHILELEKLEKESEIFYDGEHSDILSSE